MAVLRGRALFATFPIWVGLSCVFCYRIRRLQMARGCRALGGESGPRMVGGAFARSRRPPQTLVGCGLILE